MTDNRRICFKSAYNCPSEYPFLNVTNNECVNLTLPTTIITTIPKIPNTLPQKVTTIVIEKPSTIPESTILKIRCNYYLLVEEKCDFSQKWP